MARAENDSALQSKLKAFLTKVRNEHLCETWTTTEDLVARIGRALHNAIDDDEDSGQPRPGWYRGDQVPNWNVSEELARLSSENAQLRQQLEALSQDKRVAFRLMLHDEPIMDRHQGCHPHYVPIPGPMPPNHVTVFWPPKNVDQEMIEYVSKVNRTLWIPLRLRNEGTKPARSVVALLRFSGVEDIVFVRHNEPPKNSLFAPLRASPKYQDPRQPVYVQRTTKTCNEIVVEQRIQSIAVGNEEILVRLGAVLPETAGSQFQEGTFNMSYSILNENGERLEGRSEISLKLEGEKTVPIDDFPKL